MWEDIAVAGCLIGFALAVALVIVEFNHLMEQAMRSGHHR